MVRGKPDLMRGVEMISQKNIGLFGGSFDPVHYGHLILARDAMEVLGLDRVVFIPAGVSPHKLDRPPVPAELRCEMLEAAIAGEERFSLDRCEIERVGPSYAIDTVRELMAREPGVEFHYLIGEDNVATLGTWREIEVLRGLVRFVVLARNGADVGGEFPVVARRLWISSSEIRNRVADGLPVRYLLPDNVCKIIERHRLYRNAQP
jgi:nicotinate-nucleotide adenylyltransferase